MSDTTSAKPGGSGKDGRPGIPQNFITARPAPDQVILFWSAPGDGSQEGYGLSRRSGDSKDFEVIAKLDDDDITYYDRDVDAAEDVEYQLVAFNEQGDGPATCSAERAGERPADAGLGAPSLTCTPASSTSVTLVWAPRAGDPLTGFQLQRWHNGVEEKVSNYGASSTGTTDSNLVSGATYVYKLDEFNSGGYGPVTSCTTLSLE